MLIIDGRTGETRNIQAGLPQGSLTSPALFILSVSAMFQWLEDRHMKLQEILFVDDIVLVTECDDVEEGTRKLQHIARDAIQWGSDDKVDFEVSKTKVLVVSRRRKILHAARSSNRSSHPHQRADLDRRDPGGQMPRLLAGLETVVQNTLREQDGKRQRSDTAGI